jgi:hypothetical protein
LANRCYRAIGIFIGIVVRTGLCQSIPFANFVWKFLAHEPIGEGDVTQVDANLGNLFKAVREDGENAVRMALEWRVVDWPGKKTVMLQGHPRNAIVQPWEVEEFARACVEARIEAVMPAMKAIAAGFYANIGVAMSISSFFLSRAAQGDPVLSVRDLMECAEYEPGTSVEDCAVFWQVVEKMTNQQRSLLLRFVTTMTRLPLSGSGEFKFRIAVVNQPNADKVFIRAGTCFNRLWLPRYSCFEVAWERINTAIVCTPTMENG